MWAWLTVVLCPIPSRLKPISVYVPFCFKLICLTDRSSLSHPFKVEASQCLFMCLSASSRSAWLTVEYFSVSSLQGWSQSVSVYVPFCFKSIWLTDSWIVLCLIPSRLKPVSVCLCAFLLQVDQWCNVFGLVCGKTLLADFHHRRQRPSFCIIPQGWGVCEVLLTEWNKQFSKVVLMSIFQAALWF